MLWSSPVPGLCAGCAGALCPPRGRRAGAGACSHGLLQPLVPGARCAHGNLAWAGAGALRGRRPHLEAPSRLLCTGRTRGSLLDKSVWFWPSCAPLHSTARCGTGVQRGRSEARSPLAACSPWLSRAAHLSQSLGHPLWAPLLSPYPSWLFVLPWWCWKGRPRRVAGGPSAPHCAMASLCIPAHSLSWGLPP